MVLWPLLYSETFTTGSCNSALDHVLMISDSPTAGQDSPTVIIIKRPAAAAHPVILHWAILKHTNTVRTVWLWYLSLILAWSVCVFVTNLFDSDIVLKSRLLIFHLKFYMYVWVYVNTWVCTCEHMHCSFYASLHGKHIDVLCKLALPSFSLSHMVIISWEDRKIPPF